MVVYCKEITIWEKCIISNLQGMNAKNFFVRNKRVLRVVYVRGIGLSKITLQTINIEKHYY